MTTIDRYLLRQFIQSFLICYLSLTGLYIVFDAFTNLEDFLRHADKAGGLLSLMGWHYFYQSILFFDRTAALLSLVAAMFTITWIQRHNEMIALMAAGISRARVVVPVILAAIVIALLAAANRELVLPGLREELSRKPSDILGDVGQPLSQQRDYHSGIWLGGKRAFTDRQRIEKPDFELPPTLDQYGSQLRAENAFYRPPEGQHPGGYLFEGVTEPKDFAARPTLRLDGEPILITSYDEPEWLRPDQCFVVSDLNFLQLTGERTLKEFGSTAQLIAGLRNRSLDPGADLRVAIHSRMVSPFLDITLLFLGLPLVVS
ncbi:MAG TPA: LptF/LptG family permease, partial [Thermoguttaceae bacterium]|nr:LptF/LptG family permease [Thermoguttaceae bacterium]